MKAIAAIVTAAAAVLLLLGSAPRQVTVLRAGTIELHEPIRLQPGAEIFGSPRGTTLRMAADFAGAALIEANDGTCLHDFAIDGNREAVELRQGLPPWNQPFTGFTRGNGIAVDGRRAVTIRGVTFRNVAGFAILVARSQNVTIDQVRIENSGSRNEAGRNNTTGAILLEEGTADFRVTRCDLRNVLGNGIWTHSLYTSQRNARGLIEGNRFDIIGRDAIQVGHATAVRVLDNFGERIGFPAAVVDATPVGVDTAGNVDASVYAGNRFRQIDGKCIDLDGFHDGEVRGNSCANLTGFGIVMNNTNPDMQSRHIRIVENSVENSGFGGVFVIGGQNLVRGNRLLNLNTTHSEDQLLRTGIYLGDRAERPAPARGNVIEDNTITGYRMARYCIGGAPAVDPSWNVVRRNDCR